MVDFVRPVDPGALWSGGDPAPAGQGLDPHEDRTGPVPDVLAVLRAVATLGGGDRVTGVRQELVGLLVHADHRNARVVGAGVDV